MGNVYLLRDGSDVPRFKIGSTKFEDVTKRMRQIQTGNADELELISHFSTPYQYKLERMLHTKYKNKQVHGEWFLLDSDDISGFNDMCAKFSKTIESLKDNPFFFKKS